MSRQRPVPISLVIPVRDEEATLPALLASIDAQTAPPAEVVLVDAGSTDRTREIAEAHARRDGRYRLVSTGGTATPGRARNVGVAAAGEDWLALTDAGIRLEPTWLEALWAVHLEEPQAELIYGNYEFDLRSGFEYAAAVAYCIPKVATPRGRCRGPSVVSCLVHRRAFERVGGFIDSRSGEDERFTRAIEASGTRVSWAPAATVHWRLRPDLASTVERFRLYSYHYVLAGDQRHWHHRMARNYLPVGASVVLAAAHRPRWLALALAVLSARVGLRVRRHAPDTGWSLPLRPDRLALITTVTVATDAATALGWWQAARTRRRAGRT